MRPMTAEDRQNIAVGRPVPVSIYSADRTLLLAAGRVVPNEFVRDGLLRSGAFCGHEDGAAQHRAADASVDANDAIATLQADYQHTHARAPVGFRMERDGQTLTARVIGVTDDGHGLIMSGPSAAETPGVSLREGDTWTIRAFYAVAAVKFQARIEKVATEPFAYFYVSHITDVDRRNVRQWPRTPTCLWASRSGEPPRVIVDLSVGGARVAVDNRSHLQSGQVLLLSAVFNLATGRKDLSLDATVLNAYGRADSNHAQVQFYGVRFDNVPDVDRLALHAFVQEQLCFELDRVWHVLTISH
jgi:c-di-GMP-binding flagellar brake protein YcgR